MKDRTIVVESLSKTYAMTGWRIGYLLAPEAVIEQTGKIAELMHSSVNSLAQYAAWQHWPVRRIMWPPCARIPRQAPDRAGRSGRMPGIALD